MRTLTAKDRFALQGLLTVAKRQYRLLEALERAALEITGEEEYGHTSDFVWEGRDDVDELLRRLRISVEEVQ